MSDTTKPLSELTVPWKVFEIHCPVAKKKEKKLSTFLSHNKKRVSILFNQSFLFKDNYLDNLLVSGSSCRVAKDIAAAKRAAKKEQTRQEKKIEDANLFHQQMNNQAGIIISATTLKKIVQVYSRFMNKSNGFIINESKIINHRIPSKGKRLVVLNIDLVNLIKDEYEQPITLKLNDCTKIKSLNIFHKYIHIGDDNNTYCFSDVAMGNKGICMTKLDESEQDSYTYELDLFNEIYIGYEDIGVEKHAKWMDTQAVIRHLFTNKAIPIDILIAKNKIIGFQQDEYIINSIYSLNAGDDVTRADADTILRSHNLYYFDKSKFHYGFLRVIKNGDGEFWLLTEGQCKLDGKYSPDTPIKIYEHLEVLR